MMNMLKKSIMRRIVFCFIFGCPVNSEMSERISEEGITVLFHRYKMNLENFIIGDFCLKKEDLYRFPGLACVEDENEDTLAELILDKYIRRISLIDNGPTGLEDAFVLILDNASDDSSFLEKIFPRLEVKFIKNWELFGHTMKRKLRGASFFFEGYFVSFDYLGFNNWQAFEE